jgi:hypothetical protein
MSTTSSGLTRSIFGHSRVKSRHALDVHIGGWRPEELLLIGLLFTRGWSTRATAGINKLEIACDIVKPMLGRAVGAGLGVLVRIGASAGVTAAR